MNVPETIFTALRSLVSDRVYPNTFPQSPIVPVWPAIRYSLVSGDNFPNACGSSDEDEDDLTVNLDIVAESWTDMRLVKASVITALQLVVDPPCIRQPGGFETFDGETRTHRARVTYLFQQSVN